MDRHEDQQLGQKHPNQVIWSSVVLYLPISPVEPAHVILVTCLMRRWLKSLGTEHVCPASGLEATFFEFVQQHVWQFQPSNPLAVATKDMFTVE